MAYFERLGERTFRATEHTGGAWDRATQHIVSNDFLPAKRVMERVTVAGDKPF